ncbi:helix-turn-helix domain-containing protein [Paenibacillus sp. HB172176]|uniref:AraC family transcriptional regulator n=1 Tax=Paenibacillus sp. HB172176 TaxID=2493690 RepID=UPI00143B0EA3|nr:helix-turn-helix domain-containing protein [Paenibacillus sp. HB172176]
MKSRPKIFARFFLSYLIILCIPIAIGSFAYQKTVNILEEEVQNTSLMVLEHSKSSLDGQLDMVVSLLNRLSVNPKVLHFMDASLPLTDDDYYELNLLMNDLQYYLLNNSVALDFNIYFHNSDTTITSEAIYHGAAEYEIFHKYGDYSYEQFIDALMSGERRFMPPQPTKVMKESVDTIAYVSPLSTSMYAKPYGAIAIFLETEHISSLLDSLSDHFQGDAYIFDDRGQMMASTSEAGAFDVERVQNEEGFKGQVQAMIDGRDVLISYVKSSYSNWSFVAVTPKEVLFAKAYYIKKMTAIITSVILALGALAACLLAYRQSRPIRELMQAIREHYEEDGIKNVFAEMKQTFLELNSRNKKLEDIVEEQTPLFYRVFLEKLIAGSFKSEQEITAFAEHAGIRLEGERYIWIVIEMEEYEGGISDKLLKKLNFGKFVLKNMLDDLLSGEHVSMDVSERSLAYLYSSFHEHGSAAEDELRTVMEQLVQLAVNKFQLTVKIALGRPHVQLMDSWSSFQETRTALDHTPVNKIVLASELDFSSEIFYPVELEVQLINACRSGDGSSLERLFGLIYTENFERRLLSSDYRDLLLYEMKATLMKLDPAASFDQEEKERAGFSSIKGSFLELCRANERRKQAQTSDLANQMLDYVQSHYSDQSLSLNSLSERYAISESYISHLFKERAGDNFSTIVERIRMSKACEYMIDSQKSIQEIATLVGYNSDKTFRRAFKRVMGVQPTAYRDANVR